MTRRAAALAAALLAAGWLLLSGPAGASGPANERPRFLPDDPLWVDDDTLIDAGPVGEQELSQHFDFLENTFAGRGDRRDIRAPNLNTVDEVPDSMWFVNRIGLRPLTDAELVRGPDQAAALEVTDWTIVAGKSSGLQPGFRAVATDDPSGGVYQIEFDPPDFPELATGAEIIGTTIYHALGYHVVENYLVTVDPAALRIAPEATVRDRAGRPRAFAARDLTEVLDRAHRQPDGRYRGLASRWAPGRPVGHFRYYGTRPDDPNDIHPHEHRRDLRGNRVFAAWLNHDDSRAINTLDMLEGPPGAQYLRHYMFDFGSIMGSGTVGPDTPRSGRAYLVERGSSLRTLLTFGLWAPAWARAPAPAFAPSAGPFTADMPFDPTSWRPEYPNVAFDNMRADDAFWAARRVAAFSDRQLRLVVEKAHYTDPAATDQIVEALIARRDRIAEAWLTALTPVVDPALAPDGRLTFANAAVDAGAASPPTRYVARWSTYDNARREHTPVGREVTSSTTTMQAPPGVTLPERAEGAGAPDGPYVAVRLYAEHPDHPEWRRPVTAYFRREGDRWHLVGLFRDVPPGRVPSGAGA